MQLDRQDRRILRELQRDARLSNAALAARVGLSESACLRRVRLLEQAGVIERYTAVLSASQDRRDRQLSSSASRSKGRPIAIWAHSSRRWQACRKSPSAI